MNLRWAYNILTKPHILRRKFFQMAFKTFSWTARTCSRYLEGFSNLVLYVSEKFGLVRNFNQNILGRKANGRVFTLPLCKLILKKYILCPYVFHYFPSPPPGTLDKFLGLKKSGKHNYIFLGLFKSCIERWSTSQEHMLHNHKDMSQAWLHICNIALKIAYCLKNL